MGDGSGSVSVFPAMCTSMSLRSLQTHTVSITPMLFLGICADLGSEWHRGTWRCESRIGPRILGPPQVDAARWHHSSGPDVAQTGRQHGGSHRAWKGSGAPERGRHPHCGQRISGAQCPRNVKILWKREGEGCRYGESIIFRERSWSGSGPLFCFLWNAAATENAVWRHPETDMRCARDEHNMPSTWMLVTVVR